MSTIPRTTRTPRALLAFATAALLAVGGLMAPAAATAAPAPADGTVAGATLDWGVKSSFRSYVNSPIAHGSIQNLGGVTGAFRWSNGSGTAKTDGSDAAISFAAGDGAHFTGHAMNGVYALDLAFTQPQVIFTSPSSARLLLDVRGREFASMTEAGEVFTLDDVDFATVALPTPSVSGATSTWSNAQVTLTEAGAKAFGGFYSAGTVLDPLTLTANIVAPAAATSTTLAADPLTAAPGDEVTLTATVEPSSAAGSVTFLDGATTLGTQSVSGGVATLKTSALASGSHALTASFAPQDAAAHLASTSTAVTVTVSGGTTEPEPGTEWKPAVEVFLADGTTPAAGTPVYDGDTLVVKGSGFDPEANVGGRGIPIPANLPQGDYVVFGSFGADWRPSAGAPSSARQVGAQLWALTAETLEQIPAPFRETVRDQWTELHEDGTFTATLTVAAPKSEVEGGAFGIYTYAAGGMKNAEQETASRIDYRGARPTQPVEDPALEVRTGSGSTVRPGDTVSFVVTGLEAGQKVRFEVHSDPVDAGAATADAQGVARVDWTVPAGFSAGAHQVRAFRVDSAGQSEQNAFLVAPLTITAAATLPTPKPAAPAAPAEPVCVARGVSSGSMTWGLKESFRTYVEGPIAKGDFTGGSFTVRSGALNVDAGDRGQISFSGSITATGHGGLLNFRLSNPRIVLNGDGTGTLYAHVASTDTTGKKTTDGTVRFATLAFSGKSSGSTLAVSGASARLTAAGAEAFAGFYDAGTALDSVSFRVTLGGTTACDSVTDPAGGSAASLATTGSDSPVFGIAASVLLLLAGTALTVVRRRRAA
ncbi:HtaA domain-containing protein [Microbacterium sp. NPDC058342]|uniref:HtaA domain-containing protein n=1 Tax=Microbacterium sp. NPDC058342 TaxID=3346454 RepID=UPI003663A68A